MVERLDSCVIGGLALVDGLISICDLRLMREVWPLMGNMVVTQQMALVPPKDRGKASQTAKKDFDQLASIITKMPHTLQGSIATTGGFAWFTLNPEYMLVNPDDLMFKHGTDLMGAWKMVCIVDAVPDGLFKADHSDFFDSEMENAMRMVSAGLRTAFGRPPHRYGVTPVLIFRTIKKPEETEDDKASRDTHMQGAEETTDD